MFDLTKFINDGYEAQDNFARSSGETPLAELGREQRYQKVIECIGHLTEEINGEVRAHVVRRPWKQSEMGFLDSPEIREKYLDEMVDVLLFFRAILAFSDVSGEEFEQAIYEKLQYNKIRNDHKTNV